MWVIIVALAFVFIGAKRPKKSLERGIFISRKERKKKKRKFVAENDVWKFDFRFIKTTSVIFCAFGFENFGDEVCWLVV